MIHGQILEMPRLAARQHWNAVEAIPLRIEFARKLRLVFLGLLLNV